MKRYSFIMPIYKTEDTLERAIKSLLDQKDYKKWELIGVCDGASAEAEKIFDKYKSDKRIRLITIEHGGACKARNEGAKLATGDYYSFFSSDFIAHPGMIYTWERAFKDNPDCSFVYGGYDLIQEDQIIGAINSEPFDVRQLETYNYIDGGFPVKKEAYLPWDENIKSLNDWDFWLNIVEKGHKGYFLNCNTYTAEMPRPHGLSFDSATHWIERVDYIKKKHNIPDNPICVSSLGAVPHGKRMAKILGNADFMVMPSFKPHKYKMIYLLGFYPSSADKHTEVFKNAPEGCVKVVHWIGTDVFMLNAMVFNTIKTLRDLVLNKHIDYNLSEYKLTHDELNDLGIKNHVIPFPVIFDSVVPPLPEKFTIGIYMPQTSNSDSEWKYQLPLMRDLIKALPDIDFVTFGAGAKNVTKNQNNLGWCDVAKDVIPKCSALMRIVIHDGLPISPIEFLMAGRQVITNTPMAYVERIKTDNAPDMLCVNKQNFLEVKDQIIHRIRTMQRQYKDNMYDWDAIRDYYKQLCDVDKFKARINALLNKQDPIVDKQLDTYYENGSLIV